MRTWLRHVERRWAYWHWLSSEKISFGSTACPLPVCIQRLDPPDS
jgi:hypothetical protein